MLRNRKVTLLFFLISLAFLAIFFFDSFCRIKIKDYLKNGVRLTAFIKSSAPLSSEPAIKKANLPKYPFLAGEKLKYAIYSTGLKVGSVTITYLGNREVNGMLISFITLEAKLPGFYDLEKIYGDIENYAPLRIERKIQLFGQDIYITEEYNQKNNEVLITRKSKETAITKIESKEKISNIILLLYHFRYKKGYKIKDSLKFNLPTKKLEMLVDKKTQINVPKGRFSSVFVKSLPPQFKVWFSSDTDSIPLRIQGAIGFGNMYLELTDVD